MSFLSFSFLVLATYVLYYIVIITHELITAKTNKSAHADGSIHYDFGPVPAPKVAVLDDGENSAAGGLRQGIVTTDESATEEIYQENEVQEEVDLSLENMASNQLNMKSTRSINSYKH